MEDEEIKRFIRKFKSLRTAGYNASLNMECKLGEVFITLNCKVGRTVLPSPSTPSYAAVIKSRSPSYFRRQARRRASRENMDVQAENVCATTAEEVKDDTTTIEVETNCCDVAVLNDDAAVLETKIELNMNGLEPEEVGQTVYEKARDTASKNDQDKGKDNCAADDEMLGNASQPFFTVKSDGYSCNLCQFWTSRKENIVSHMSLKHGQSLIL